MALLRVHAGGALKRSLKACLYNTPIIATQVDRRIAIMR